MKKIYYLFFVTLVAGIIFNPQATHAQSPCEQLVWKDEFDGNTLDQSKWKIEVGGGGWGTGQLDYATDRPENVKVENGNLYLTLREENYENHAYTSGRINTYQKMHFKYGRIEARVKGVHSPGVGFAFWMLGANYETIFWPKSGEVDIFEQTGKSPGFNIGTAHFEEAWGHSINQGSITLPNNERFADDYHIAGIQWTPDSISWYIDDNYYHTMYIDEPINGFDPFNREFFLILSVGMAGDYSGLPDETTVLPQSAVIDWVRVYKGDYAVEISGDNVVYEGETKEYEVTGVENATFNWQIPNGATITSGQGTNKISVQWGDTQTSGTVQVEVAGCSTQTYALEVEVEPAIIINQIYEDFEANQHVQYGYFSGILETKVPNPSPDGINNSALVGKYQRNADEPWDALVMEGISTGHAGAFITGKKRFFMDIYTDAPAGTKITLGLENSAVATPEYPYGKHSNYEAFTTVQNGWEILEFVLTGIPDQYAGSYKVDQAVFLFDPGKNSGHTYYFDNFRSGQSGEDAPILAVEYLKDWEDNSKISLISTTGQYQEFTANPAPDAINASANTLKYSRNADLTYDNITYQVALEDASYFREGTNTLVMDIYTNADPGKLISMHLIDSTIDGSSNWEAPIHSIYETKITEKGKWQTVEFQWSSNPNPAVPNVNINRVVFLIDENHNTGDTYYIDNIRINSSRIADSYVLDNMLEDYESNHSLSYVYSADPYQANISNPAKNDINNSDLVGLYQKQGEGDDWLVFDLTKTIDAKALKEKQKVIMVDVYTDAPAGTLITMGLEAGSLAIPENWPTGRHSDYAAAIKTQNEWHTIKFIYSNSSDPSTPANLVNKATFTFNQGNEGSYNFYLDNFKVMGLVEEETLNKIIVTPSLVENIKIGDIIQFTANGLDQFGNPFPIDITWSTTGGGNIDQSGHFTATENGTFKVTAQQGNVSGVATIVISSEETPSNDNLALNKPAFSSSDENGGTPATNAVDGNSNTRWASAFSDPQWIYVDLGQSYSINQVKLNWETASGKAYEIQVSDNATDWSTIYSTTSGEGGEDNLTGLNGTGRYVRVYGTERNTGYGYSLWELEVYGTDLPSSNNNIALNKPVTASSTQSGLPVENVNDEDANTRWSSDWSDPQWVQIDLQDQYHINKVVLDWEAASGKAYEIQVSDNGTNWNTLFTETDGNGGKEDINLSGTGRYVRLSGTQRNTGYGYSLYEFEVYGTKGIGTLRAVNNEKSFSLEALNLDKQVSIYPVPVKDVLNISFAEGSYESVEILDLAGKTFYKTNIKGLSELQSDLSGFPKGPYIIKLRGSEATVLRRIIKQ